MVLNDRSFLFSVDDSQRHLLRAETKVPSDNLELSCLIFQDIAHDPLVADDWMCHGCRPRVNRQLPRYLSLC